MNATGLDAEQVEAELASENARADAAGSGPRFGSAPGVGARSGAAQRGRCRCAAARSYARRK